MEEAGGKFPVMHFVDRYGQLHKVMGKTAKPVYTKYFRDVNVQKYYGKLMNVNYYILHI